MAMRTDVKRFNAADVGLSANMYRGTLLTFFKAILTTGYNSKVANITNVNGNIITLDYGVPHGYALHRILKISGNPLLNGEHAVTSINTNTLTIELESTVTISGTITTQVAPLGFELVYEATNVAIYRFNYKGKEKYLRLYETPNYNAYINPSVGDGFDVNSGTLTGDIYPTSSISTQNPYRWDFNSSPTGVPFELPSIFGTSEGFVLIGQMLSSARQTYIHGILPWHTVFDKLKTPILICAEISSYSTSHGSNIDSRNFYLPIIGKVHSQFQESTTSNTGFSDAALTSPVGNSIPNTILGFNAVSYGSLVIQQQQTNQILGIANGVHSCLTNITTANNTLSKIIESYDAVSNEKIWLRKLDYNYRYIVMTPYEGFD